MTSSRIFRSHDTLPADIRCPILRGLLEEWYLLHQNPSTRRLIARWGRTETVLDRYTTPGAIVDAIDVADPEHTDQLLLALLRLHHGDHQVAGRILLQCFLPRLSRMHLTRYDMRTGDPGTWQADSRAMIIAEFWDVLASYPTHRTSKIPSRLILDTTHRITQTKTYTRNPDMIPTDLASREDQLPLSLDPTPGDLNADSDLMTVLHWAHTTHVITRDEAQLLSDYDLPQRTRRADPLDASSQDGVSAAAHRQRRSRIVRRLVEAVRAELDTADRLPIAAVA